MDELKKEFDKLLDALHKCKKHCPWTKEQTVETYAKNVADEAEEMLAAVEKKDYANLKEELGDILWDTLMTAHLAEEHGHFRVVDVLKNAVDKMKRRKPYIFEGGSVTIEEAKRIWKEAKQKEKSGTA